MDRMAGKMADSSLARGRPFCEFGPRYMDGRGRCKGEENLGDEGSDGEDGYSLHNTST
jgi:hypothetical protein